MEQFWQNLFYILPVLLVTFYIYYERTYSYWKKRGIPQPTPLPIVGNFLNQLIYGPLTVDQYYWKKYGNVWGTYNGSQPALNIADTEMIKQVLIRDFPSFVNRRIATTTHEVWSKNAFTALDDSWKRIRTIMSPSFTSGKLRGMTDLMNESVDKLSQYFDKLSTDGKPFVVKKIISGFTIDVISSTSFAINPDSNGSREKENPYVYHGMGLFKFNPLRILTLNFTPQWLKNLLGFQLAFTPKHFNFFNYLMKNVIEERRRTGVKRNDLTQLMIDAFQEEDDLDKINYDKLTATGDDSEGSMDTKSNGKSTSGGKGDSNGSKKLPKTMTDNEIIAQMILAYVAGFETTATTLTNICYELAMAPALQEELKEELDSKLKDLKRDSAEYYETVNNGSPLMNAFIKETLRKYAPVQKLTRVCGVDGYNLAGIELFKGQQIEIPVFAVHYNPEFYPEPERFDPHRFMDPEKSKKLPYLPFGDGPRNCIGMRFAYLEIKLFIAQIVRNYRFIKAPSTPDKLKFTKIGVSATEPFELCIQKRS